MAISDKLLGGCLEAFIPENFYEILQIGEEENQYMKWLGSSINVVQLSFHDTRPGTHIRINIIVHTSTAGDSQHCCLLIFLSFFCVCFCLSVRQLYLTIVFGDNYSVFLWFFFSLLGEHLSDMPAQNKAHPALRQCFNFSSTTTAECVWVCLQQQCFPGTNCGKMC